jgi:xanthine dehydrogenase YagS FAD-binding subunit
VLFELPDFEHIDARDVNEAVSCLCEYGGEASVIAGATDLLALMKDRIEGPKLKSPKVLVNIKTIGGIDGITEEERGGLRIGAAITLRQLAASDRIREKFSILSQAALQVGTTQIRNMGTLGGNLCQRPRCAYFRHPHFICFKKGGGRCHAVAGEHRFYHSILKNGRCVMAHPSDMAPALVALKATAVIAGVDGERKIPLRDFFVGPESLGETNLQSDEFLLAIDVPPQPVGTRQVFLKHRIRHAADFALASVALVARISDGDCDEMSIVLGGVAPLPYEAVDAGRSLRGKRLTGQLISDAAETCVTGARPLPMNGYKVDLTKALVRNVLRSIAETPNR